MPAYILSIIEVTNPGPRLKEYSELSAKLARQHGGRYIVRGKPANVEAGDKFVNKVVIMLEFPNMDQLNAFYTSDAYQKDCKPLREGTGIYDIAFFEAPPPGAA
jgi:uncharacterized protein (DUF1330 family)